MATAGLNGYGKPVYCLDIETLDSYTQTTKEKVISKAILGGVFHGICSQG